MKNRNYDKIIIGAGVYGMYAALKCGEKGESILLLEYDDEPFMRATYINQARVHYGYHYPRSLSTAAKSANYYIRFHEDYNFSINGEFSQIYATSAKFSWTNADAFKKFCKAANIKCLEIDPSEYFNKGMCDGAFLTEEDTIDTLIMRDYFVEKLAELKNVEIRCSARISSIIASDGMVEIEYSVGDEKYTATSSFMLNATYASVNQVLSKIDNKTGNDMDLEKFRIKYELCEIVRCTVNDELKNIGLTVMDGPFFSIMPFGKTEYHSLTAVTFTPHVTCYDRLPSFECQNGVQCKPEQLGNCNTCPHKPTPSWDYMRSLAQKYMKSKYQFEYKDSLFSMKPILKASEIDDSRPTAIKVSSESPKIISVLSGKINTMYDLDEYLEV